MTNICWLEDFAAHAMAMGYLKGSLIFYQKKKGILIGSNDCNNKRDWLILSNIH